MLARRLLIALALALALAAPAHAAVPRGWTTVPSMSTDRIYASGVVLDDGRFLVAGGSTRSGVTASAEIYDPATNAWSPTGSMTDPRDGFALVKLNDGRVLAAGGSTAPGVATGSSELYDPATGTWQAAGSMSEHHTRGEYGLLGDGTVLFAGGYSSNSTWTNVAEQFNPTSRKWTSARTLPGSARADGDATLLSNGGLLVAGGYTGTALSGQSAIYGGGGWASTGSLTARNFPKLSPLPGGRALATGGGTGGSAGYSNLVEIYNPTTNGWLPGPPMAAPRFGHTATVIGGGKVLVASGFQSVAAGAGTTAEIYDPAANTWSSAGALAVGRWQHVAGLLHDGRVIVAGGYTGPEDGTQTTATAEIWTATTALVTDPALTFGDQLVGAGASAGVQVTNTGDQPLLLADFAVGGINPGDFTVNGRRCGVIAPNTTCALDVRFAPTAGGSRSATLTFSANTAAGTYAIPLGGRAVADADGDGVTDANDRCRTLKGSASRSGCPKGLLADPSISYQRSGKGIRVVAYYVKATTGARLTVKCSKGCKRTVTKGKGSKRVRITRLSRKRLANGTKITITASKAGRLTTTVVDRVSRGRRIEGRPRCSPVGC